MPVSSLSRPFPPRSARLGLAVSLLAVLAVGACSGTASQSAAAQAAGGSVAPRPSLVLRPPTATPLASAPAQPAGDGTTVTLHTEKGDIVIAIYDLSAPVASQNFVNLARAGFYNGVVFHRIVPGFVIQGGDPTGTGAGGPGYSFPDEPFAGSYTLGTVAMANAGPNTNGSQFFIVVGDGVQLPPDYTIFGKVTSGMDIAQQIASGPRGGPQDDQALQPVRILSATVTQP